MWAPHRHPQFPAESKQPLSCSVDMHGDRRVRISDTEHVATSFLDARSDASRLPCAAMRLRVSALLALSWAALGCRSVPPPASPMPNGQAALDRMKATYGSCNGIQADAKIDHYG